MPTSEARISANQQNATRSTGPKTEAGKEKSRQNSYKHGMTGAGVVMPESDAIEVERRTVVFATELASIGEIGASLARRVAVHSVRMERSVDQQAAALCTRIRQVEADFVPPEGVDEAGAVRLRSEAVRSAMFDPSREATLARQYEVAAERGFFRAIKQMHLMERQEEAFLKADKAAYDQAMLGSFIAAQQADQGRDDERAARSAEEMFPMPGLKPMSANSPYPVTLGTGIDIPMDDGPASLTLSRRPYTRNGLIQSGWALGMRFPIPDRAGLVRFFDCNDYLVTLLGSPCRIDQWDHFVSPDGAGQCGKKLGTRLLSIIAVLSCLTASTRAVGQGLISSAGGPINSSMAGASMAAPVDFGSSYWNAAAISGLDSQEFLLGSSLILPSAHLQTFLPAGTIGGVFPQTDRSGTSRSNSGVASNLATGVSFRLSDDSPWTLGLGIFGLAGGGVNFPGSNNQPLLTPHNPPKTFGFGPIYSSLSTLEITPIASYQATSKLAVAAGPVITSTNAAFSPAFFAPNPKDGFGLPTFPNATNYRPFWGGGFQVGLLYNINKNWNFGFSYKSPIWMERWSYNSSAANGSARYIGVQAGLPEIISWGLAYKGLPKTLIDVDLRYFDYADTPLFGQKVVNGGLGWRSVFAVATGAQYQLTEKTTLRAGYLYNTNPIPSTATLFNVQAPGITQHTLSLGASYKLSANITSTVAWVHGFRNSIEGGVSQIPGASARIDVQTDSIVLGLNIQFGKKRNLGPTPSTEDEYAPTTTSPTFTRAPELPPMPISDGVVPTSTDPAPTAPGPRP